MNNIQTTSDTTKSTDKGTEFLKTLIKPGTNFAVSYAINKYYFTDSTITIGPIPISQPILYSLINSATSYGQELLKTYLLPTFLEEKLVTNFSFLINPLVCGIAVLIARNVLNFYQSKSLLTLRGNLYIFFMGMVAELISIYLYEYIVKSMMESMGL